MGKMPLIWKIPQVRADEACVQECSLRLAVIGEAKQRRVVDINGLRALAFLPRAPSPGHHAPSPACPPPLEPQAQLAPAVCTPTPAPRFLPSRAVSQGSRAPQNRLKSGNGAPRGVLWPCSLS